MYAYVLKFHIWIPHKKIGNPYFFFLSKLSHILELLCPKLRRSWRGILLLGCSYVRSSFHPSILSSRFLMLSMSLEPCVIVLKFLIWIPHEKISHIFFFFLTGLCPFSELWPFEKIWMQSCLQNISKTIELEP